MIFNDGLPFKGFMDTENYDEFNDYAHTGRVPNTSHQPLGGGSNSVRDNEEGEADRSLEEIMDEIDNLPTDGESDDGLNEEEGLGFLRNGGDMLGTTTENEPVNDDGIEEFYRAIGLNINTEEELSEDNAVEVAPLARRNARRVMENLGLTNKNSVKEARKDIAEEIKKRYGKILNHIGSVITTLDGMDSDISSSVIVGLLRNIINNNSDQEIKTEVNKLKNPIERRLDNIG